MKKQFPKFHFAALAAGFVSGLAGTGGGLLLLPRLRRSLSPARCQATLMAVTVPISACCCLYDLLRGRVLPGDVLPFLPGGMSGALLGSFLLPRISPRLLRGVFGLLLLYGGARQLGILC